jgi:hypothetical protein
LTLKTPKIDRKWLFFLLFFGPGTTLPQAQDGSSLAHFAVRMPAEHAKKRLNLLRFVSFFKFFM